MYRLLMIDIVIRVIQCSKNFSSRALNVKTY